MFLPCYRGRKTAEGNPRAGGVCGFPGLGKTAPPRGGLQGQPVEFSAGYCRSEIVAPLSVVPKLGPCLQCLSVGSSGI